MIDQHVKILFEDENIIAVDKTEGISSISENDKTVDSIHSLLQKKYSSKIFIVHRLDKEVSGVILFAKNNVTHKLLNEQFQNRKVIKHYAALVHGNINAQSGIIDKPIREFGSGRMGIDEIKGKPSITEFNVLKQSNSLTLLDLHPTTGRRHQLRVHLYSIGHPIVGEMKYGDKNIQQDFPRLMLHAINITFRINTGKIIKIESELPDIFNTF